MKGKFNYDEFDEFKKKKKKKHKKNKKQNLKVEKALTYKKPTSENNTSPKVVINLNIGTDFASSMLTMLFSQLANNDDSNERTGNDQ